MVEVVRSTVIDAPIEAVWAILRDFNGHDQWHPAVAESAIENGRAADEVGCVRRFALAAGGEIREQLLALSDRDHSFTYCILDAPIPLQGYVATLSLRRVTNGERTFWHWRSEFTTPPGRDDELARMVGEQIYVGGMEAVRSLLSARGRPDGRVETGPVRTTAVVVHRHGGPGELRLEEASVTPPGRGEVRLRQTAIGVNYIDVHVRTGHYPLLTPPGTPGMEAAGMVTDVGEGVVGIVPGDRVAYACPPVGAYAGVRIMAADQLVVLPDDIADDVAAAIMLKGMTAEYLLHRTHRVKAGDTILVQAAAGGVGLLLCQWARHLGATVIGTVGSSEKARLARAHGCAFPIDLASEDLAARVREITAGRGCDVVYDSIGGTMTETSLACLAMRGHLVSYGQSSGAMPAVDAAALSSKSASFSRPVLFHYTATPSELQTIAANLFAVVRAGIVRVPIHQRRPLAEAAAAHIDLEARRTTGATVLVP